MASAAAWRDIPGFLGYQASRCGLIRNKYREIPQFAHSIGYKTVNMNCKSVLVHRAVALAWIPNPQQKPTVNHKDRVRTNNTVSNLEWATMLEQNRDRRRWKKLPRLADEPDLDGETWMTVDVFEISNMGRVRRNGKIVQYTQTDEPYVSVRKNDNTKHKLHRLVAVCFVDNDDPERKTVVNHIDGNKRNNAASNLEWCTPSENSLHAYQTGLKRAVGKPVDQLDLDTGRLVRRFESQADAARAAGTTRARLRAAAVGGGHVGGYAWRYVGGYTSSDSEDSDDPPSSQR